MLLDHLFRLDEVHWTDLYPKSFAEFRKTYLKKARNGGLYGLYVQFTNHSDNALDRNAYQSPDHNDPVGVYGYPMDYVLKHPADVWYGRGARYLRVLASTASSTLYLRSITSEDQAISILRGCGMKYYDAVDSLRLAAKHYSQRVKGTNRWAKLFMSALQIDLLSQPVDHRAPGFFDKGGPVFRTRTGAEQTAMLRKGGYDAVVDDSRTNKSAIINDREPEQIIFLTRNAFRVVEVIDLRSGIPDHELGLMAINGPDAPRTERKLAAAIAAMLDDKITESGRDDKTRKRSKLDGAYHYYWTKKGRRIEIGFERPQSYYDGKRMGEKKHRDAKLYDAFRTDVAIRTEIGDIKMRFDSDETFIDIVASIGRVWRRLEENPKPSDWVPQTATSFMQGIVAARDAELQKKIDAEMAQALAYWPQFTASAEQVASLVGASFDEPERDDAKAFIVRSMEALSNMAIQKGFDADPLVALDAWLRYEQRDWSGNFVTDEATARAEIILHVIEQIGAILKKASTIVDLRWPLRAGAKCFEAILRETGNGDDAS